MKKNEAFKELRDMADEALRERRRSLAEELLKLRFRRATGQLEQSHRVRELKRNLARAQTLLNQRKQAGASAGSGKSGAVKG